MQMGIIANSPSILLMAHTAFHFAAVQTTTRWQKWICTSAVQRKVHFTMAEVILPYTRSIM